MRRRTAITATTGRRAATEPFTLISAVSTATSSIMRTITRGRLPPDRAISSWPAHAVTPVESSPSLTTNSEAMKITAGSPKPPSDCSSSSTPVAQSESATPTATIADREPVPDEDGHRRGEDQEGDRRLAHTLAAARGRSVVTPSLRRCRA